MLGELLYPEHLKAHLATILEWKNLIIHNVYGAEPYKLEDMLAWCEEFGGKLRPFLCDVPKYLYEAEKAGKNIMFEAQLGALRDIDFGIYPYTSSSSSIAGYACVGAGMPGSHVDRTVGIVKAYSTCVGEGRSQQSGLARRPRTCVKRAANTALPPAVRAASAD